MKRILIVLGILGLVLMGCGEQQEPKCEECPHLFDSRIVDSDSFYHYLSTNESYFNYYEREDYVSFRYHDTVDLHQVTRFSIFFPSNDIKIEITDMDCLMGNMDEENMTVPEEFNCTQVFEGKITSSRWR